jgi:hypothetical protein
MQLAYYYAAMVRRLLGVNIRRVISCVGIASMNCLRLSAGCRGLPARVSRC